MKLILGEIVISCIRKVFLTKLLGRVGYNRRPRLLFPPPTTDTDKKVREMSNYALNERQDCSGDDKPRQTTRTMNNESEG